MTSTSITHIDSHVVRELEYFVYSCFPDSTNVLFLLSLSQVKTPARPII